MSGVNLYTRISKRLERMFSKENYVHYTSYVFHNKKYKIGEYTYGIPTVLFENESANLTIGKFCSIAEGVTIFLGGNHRVDWISTYPFNIFKQNFPEAEHIKGHPSTKGDVEVGNDVWIGRNASILSGVKIGNGAVIASGAVVTKNIGPYEIWGGNPATFIKKRFDDKEITKLLEIKWWDWDIELIKKNIGLICNANIEEFIKVHAGKN